MPGASARKIGSFGAAIIKHSFAPLTMACHHTAPLHGQRATDTSSPVASIAPWKPVSEAPARRSRITACGKSRASILLRGACKAIVFWSTGVFGPESSFATRTLKSDSGFASSHSRGMKLDNSTSPRCNGAISRSDALLVLMRRKPLELLRIHRLSCFKRRLTTHLRKSHGHPLCDLVLAWIFGPQVRVPDHELVSWKVIAGARHAGKRC